MNPQIISASPLLRDCAQGVTRARVDGCVGHAIEFPLICPIHMSMLNQHSTDVDSIEGRTILKLKIRILPFVWLLYIVAFLDRINIGFAALTMNKELAITSQRMPHL
jgi:hypothetical protein